MVTAPLPKANEVEAHDQSERRQNKNQGQNNVCGCDIVMVVVATKGKTIWVLKAILQEAIVIVVA